MSLASTSTQLSPGQATAILNLRGRYTSPYTDSVSPAAGSADHGLVAVDPQLPVGAGLRAEAGHELGDQRPQHGLAVVRPGHAMMLRTTSPHAASVLSSRLVDPVDQRPQLALVHEVELHALAGGQAHRAVGDVGQAVEGEPLVGRDHAARHGGADHARVGERQLLALPARGARRGRPAGRCRGT